MKFFNINLILAFTAVTFSVQAQTTMYTGIITNGSTNGISYTQPDAVYDAMGFAHVCYSDATNKDLVYSTNSSGKWVATTVDSTGDVGSQCSIALSSANKVHISYYDFTNKKLKYATNEFGTWGPITLPWTYQFGRDSAIALDNSNRIHIAYTNETSRTIEHAYADNALAAPWIETSIDSGTSPSIAIDSSDNVHIAYIDSAATSVKYATNETGAWVTETASSNGAVTHYTAIALDSTDAVHVAFMLDAASSTPTVKHADTVSGSWSVETVSSAISSSFGSVGMAIASDDTLYISLNYKAQYATASNTPSATGREWTTNSATLSGDSGYTHSALTLSAMGQPLLVFKTANSDIGFATTTSQWNISALETSKTGQVGSYSSVAVEGSTAIISYYDTDDKEIEYIMATLTDNHIASSTVVVADTVPVNSGQWSAAAIHSDESFFIAYSDVTDGDAEIYSSTSALSSSSKQTIESTGSVGTYNSVAIDSSGHAHVAYYDATNADLKYATNASGSWVVTTVDGTGSRVGMYADLALDDADNVHISYFAAGNTNGSGQLKYATNSSGSWQTETVISESGMNGFWTSIAVDSSGNVHISSYAAASKDLKYSLGSLGSWSTSTIDESGDVGSYSSITVDANDQVHISYYDKTNTDLKYATDEDADGTFETETVDKTSNDVGQYSSIALVGTSPVISYYDASAKDLRVAVYPATEE